MEIVVIYKQDGTVQCNSDIKPRSLDHDETLLKKHGVTSICASGNVPGPLIVTARCGALTSQVNAFAVSFDDWTTFQRGIVGTLGFERWSGAPLPDLGWSDDCFVCSDPADSSDMGFILNMPVLVRELIGMPCRCYQIGDAITQDYRPDRINIVLDEDSRIVRIHFG